MKLEIAILLHLGLKPKDVAEKLGVSKGLVYYYNKQYKEAMPKVMKALGGSK